MKNNKIILLALLAGYLVATSCTETRDPSKDIVYRFIPEVVLPSDIPSGKKQILSIMLKSPVYNNGFLNHECVYQDDKNSYLLSPKGDIIKPGEKFSISNIDEYIRFNFYSEDLGDHNLKFTFKNSIDFTETREYKVSVEKATFKIILKNLELTSEIEKQAEIEYLFEVYDELNHSYKMKFEIEGNHRATLNGFRAGEWFNISKTFGKLLYNPLTLGTHKVKISVRNNEDVEKNTTFAIKSIEKIGPNISNLSIGNFEFKSSENLIVDRKITNNLLLHVNLDFNTNSPYIKGRFIMSHLDAESAFECIPDKEFKCSCEFEVKIPDDKYRTYQEVRSGSKYRLWTLEISNISGGKSYRSGHQFADHIICF